MPGNMRILRRILGLVLLALSSGMFLWGVWPFPDESESIVIPPDHHLVLSWPVTTRIGDAGSVRLQIEPGNTTVAPQPGEEHSNEMASARLEFAGLRFYPGETVSQPLRPGMPLTFRWQFRPEDRGDFTGVSWLYLLDVPRDGGQETETPVAAREIRIHVVDLFGLSGPSARLLGGIGLLVGGLLGLDGALAWLQKRVRRQTGLQPAPELVEQ